MPIQKTEKIWRNGQLIAWDDAMIHVMSHVVHYGSAVFEGVRCYKLPSGPAIFRAEEHMQRLLDSAKIYRMEVPYTRQQLIDATAEVIRVNGAWPCYIRPSFSAATARSGSIRWRARLTFISPTSRGASTWRRAMKGLTCAFPPGRAWRPTRCRRWPRRLPTT